MNTLLVYRWLGYTITFDASNTLNIRENFSLAVGNI